MFRALQRGPRSGRINLAGNVGTDRQVGAPVLVVLGADSAAVVERLTVREPRGRDWLVFAAAVSADEKYVAISYHGSDTTGADWIRLSPQLRVCSDLTPPNTACLPLHGEIAFRGDDLVATGEGPLIELTLAGRRVHAWRPQLPANHLTQFAIDRTALRAAVIGSCGYRGGLSIIDLASGRTTVLGYPQTICGEGVSFVNANVLAVGRDRLPVPQGTPAEIEFVDLSTRRISHRTSTPSDVLALR